MSDKTRREILVMLKERNLSAGEIAEKFSLTKATVSHHLSVLRQAGLVDTEKRAQTVIYSLNLTVFQSFLLAVNGLFADKDFKGSRKAETTGSPSGRSAAERVSATLSPATASASHTASETINAALPPYAASEIISTALPLYAASKETDAALHPYALLPSDYEKEKKTLKMTIFSAAFRHTGDKTWKEAVFRTISDIRR